MLATRLLPGLFLTLTACSSFEQAAIDAAADGAVDSLVSDGSPPEVAPEGGAPDGPLAADLKQLDSAPVPSSWTQGKGGKPGDSIQTLTFAGKQRTFAVHVPPSYVAAKGVSLLLHFHGFRNLPAGVQSEVVGLWGPVSDGGGFIAVAPEGLPCPQLNMGSNVGCFLIDRDGPFVAALIKHLGGLYNLDRKKVHLSGHSGGAFFAQSYGLQNPESIASAVEFAGGCVYTTGYMNDCAVYDKLSKQAKRKLPFYIAHNKLDQVVPAKESLALLQLLNTNGHSTQHLDTYNGGSSGHGLTAAVAQTAWNWLKGFALP